MVTGVFPPPPWVGAFVFIADRVQHSHSSVFFVLFVDRIASNFRQLALSHFFARQFVGKSASRDSIRHPKPGFGMKCTLAPEEQAHVLGTIRYYRVLIGTIRYYHVLLGTIRHYSIRLY